MDYYLGIHCGHDATASLIDENGNLLAAIAEERITRVKYHAGFPYRAIETVLQMNGLSKRDIKNIGCSTKRLFYPGEDWFNNYMLSEDLELKNSYDISNLPSYESPIKRLFKVIRSKGKTDLGKSNEEIEKFTRDVIEKTLRDVGFSDFDLNIYDHHLCHASSAAYLSGVEEALVITMDGAGDGKCATANLFKENNIQSLSFAPSTCSPGRIYSEITRFLGYKRNRHEGKITGLAAYGDPNKHLKSLEKFIFFDRQKETFDWNAPSERKVLRKWKTFKRILNNTNFGNPQIDYLSEYLRENLNPKKDAEDLSASVQKLVENLAAEYVSHFKNKTGQENILLAGGVFANVRVNQLISEMPNVKFTYIHQNMGDGGCATGAAYLFRTESNSSIPERLNDVYLGPSYTNEEIEEALAKFENINFRRSDQIEQEVAELIDENKIVGRFSGGMEYGPRSLGNRSILAKTTDRDINDWLNKRLNRTEFMPFAPAVLEEQSETLFKNFDRSSAKYASEFMTVTYNVDENWHEKLQAAVHVDGTARPQVVTKTNNPKFHKVLTSYYELSGIPALINTSFNSHEEPIVMSPEHAIKSLIQGTVDVLAIEDFLVTKI